MKMIKKDWLDLKELGKDGLVFLAVLLTWVPLMNFYEGDILMTSFISFVVFVTAKDLVKRLFK